MNRRAILLSSLAILMLFASIAPVFGCREREWERGTFTQGIVQFNTSSGAQWMTGNILHAIGGSAISYVYGSPWGNSLSGSGTTVYFELDTVSLIGRSVDTVVDTYAKGTVVGTIFNKINGAGPYTYFGPTFTFNLDGKTGTITQGATYVGGLISGFATKYGISGDLKGLRTIETYTGVNIKVGPLAGVIVIDNTVSYQLRG